MTRHYTLVDAIEDPDDPGAITADVPQGANWVGNTNGTTYIVLTLEPVPGIAMFAAEVEDEPWEPLAEYAVDDRRAYDSIVYRCIQPHTNANTADTPPLTPALWTVARADGDPWVQPTMAEDAYSIGRVVLHDSILYRSKIDANTTTPGSDGRWWEPIQGVVEVARDLGAPIGDRDPLERWNVGGA